VLSVKPSNLAKTSTVTMDVTAPKTIFYCYEFHTSVLTNLIFMGFDRAERSDYCSGRNAKFECHKIANAVKSGDTFCRTRYEFRCCINFSKNQITAYF
jgi:hypothetical protein